MNILKTLLIAAIPAIMAYFSSDDSLLDIWKKKGILGDQFDIDLVKQILLVGSVILTSLWLTLQNERYKGKMKVTEEQRIALIRIMKEAFLSNLAEKVCSPDLSTLRIRIWTEDKKFTKFLELIRCWIMNQTLIRTYIIKNVAGLSYSDNTENLSFIVSPQSELQGLVGMCYDKKSIVLDDDLHNTQRDYNLNNQQKSKTNGTRFCLCYPIFDDNSNIISIVSFDTNVPITIPDDKLDTLSSTVTEFCQGLYQNCPELFR